MIYTTVLGQYQLFLGVTLLLSLASHALVGTALSGGWATYFYLSGGYVTAGSVYCLIEEQVADDESYFCDSANSEYLGGHLGVILLGLLVLDDGSQQATFPELNDKLIASQNLQPEQITSYNSDLTKLRLLSEDLNNKSEFKSPKDVKVAAVKLETMIIDNFSQDTVDVINAIKAYNMSK